MWLRSGVFSCLTLLFLLATVPVTVNGADNAPGSFSSHWYNPDRNGAGIVLEILDDQRATAYWFTYDDEGQPRWVIGVGDWVQAEDGLTVSFPELEQVTGGVFGDQFDSTAIEFETIGSATFQASTCDTAEWSFEAFGTEASYEVVRLSHPMTQRCGIPQGLPGDAFEAYASQSGSWFNPDRSGEGFTLQWIARNQALLAWFTFDHEGNPQWMTGIGSYQDGRIVFSDITTREGGSFVGPITPGSVDTEVWGDLELELSCGGGTMSYTPADETIQPSSINVQPLTSLQGIACPYTRPTFLDLFNVSLTDLPLHTGDGVASNYNATGVSDHGLVVVQKFSPTEPVKIFTVDREGSQLEFVTMAGSITTENLLPFVDNDGQRIYHDLMPEPEESNLSVVPGVWREETGWQRVPDQDVDNILLYGISESGDVLTGRARKADYSTNPPTSESYPFVWSESTGYKRAEISADMHRGKAYGVSNDTRVLVGEQEKTLSPEGGDFLNIATRWVDGAPQKLTDQAGDTLRIAYTCALDCDLIVGARKSDPAKPRSGESWYWTEESGAVFLGTLDDAAFPEYIAFSVAEDGSLIAGTYPVQLANGNARRSTFLWTPATGIVSLTQVLREVALYDDRWYSMQPNDVTSDGSTVLLVGQRVISFTGRASLLDITPRVNSR